MLRGILTFFTSGAFLNPMVLGGIFVGILIKMFTTEQEVFNIYGDLTIYIAGLFLSFLYSILFKRIYKLGGKELDYVEMGVLIVGGAAKFVFASFLTISFVMMLFF